MLKFLAIFFVVYGGAHVYLLWKVHAALPGLGRWQIALWAFCAAMVVGPVAARLLQGAGYGQPGSALGLICYIWMAVAWWFVVVMVAFDAWNLLARGAALAWPAAQQAVVPARWSLAIAGVLVFAAAVWGLVEARSIRLATVEIATSRLPAGAEPIRIAQITDLHLGATTGEDRLARALEIVRRAKPHLVVATGDMSDLPMERAAHMAAMVRTIEAPLGKLAVTGNHEFYVGLDSSAAFHDAAGFRLLRGEAVAVGEHLLVVGVDDPAGRRTGEPCLTDEAAVLPQTDDGRFVLLLKHRPDVEDASVGRFDLQMSGHTHGGQLFPWHVFTRMRFRYVSGLHRLPGGRSSVYVSRGTGTWGPPMRLLAPPEVTLVVLRPAAAGAAE